jgi:hypothetical protein
MPLSMGLTGHYSLKQVPLGQQVLKVRLVRRVQRVQRVRRVLLGQQEMSAQLVTPELLALLVQLALRRPLMVQLRVSRLLILI